MESEGLRLSMEPPPRKPFLGGYRHKETQVEYHHAAAQTDRVEKPPKDMSNVLSRRVQTSWARSKFQQTDRDRSTQTAWASDVELGGEGRIVAPSSAGYETAERYIQARAHSVMLLQRAVRAWIHTRRERRARALAEEEEEDFFPEEDQEEAPAVMIDLKNAEIPAQKAVDKEEYQRIMAELENNREEEGDSEEARMNSKMRRFRARAKKAKGVAMEAQNLAKAVNVRDKMRAAERDALIRKIIMKTGNPKQWRASDGGVIQVETMESRRARELANAYIQLGVEYEEWEVDQQERVRNLRAIQEMADRMPLREGKDGRELLELVARELSLIDRGVRHSNLAGLRTRILSALFRLIRTPEFNPEIMRYERQLPVRLIRPPKPPVPSAKPGLSSVVAATELCYGCRRHLPRTAFPLSSGAVVGRCLSCARLDNAARSGHDLSAFKAMMERIKAAEEEENNTSSPVFQMQDSDIRYMVLNFWGSQSVLSGCSELENLRFVRWRPSEEWAPWNCVLLTEREAKVHRKIGDNMEEVYQEPLIDKVRFKHTMAKSHFSKMSTMSKFFENGRPIKTKQ